MLLLTIGLAIGMVHLDVSDWLPGAEEVGALAPGGLVRAAQGLGLLLRPVDEVLKEGQAQHPVDVFIRDCQRRVSNEINQWRCRRAKQASGSVPYVRLYLLDSSPRAALAICWLWSDSSPPAALAICWLRSDSSLLMDMNTSMAAISYVRGCARVPCDTASDIQTGGDRGVVYASIYAN